MKKFLMLAVMLFLCAGYANAQEEKKFSGLLDKVSWKQGVAWSLQESTMNALSTVEIIKFEKYVKGLTFEVGTAGDGDDSDWKLVVVMSYPLLNLKEKGVTIPILDLVDANVGAWFGAGHLNKDMMNSRSDYGVSLSLLNFKW